MHVPALDINSTICVFIDLDCGTAVPTWLLNEAFVMLSFATFVGERKRAIGIFRERLKFCVAQFKVQQYVMSA